MFLGNAMGDSMVLSVLRQNKATISEKIVLASTIPELLTKLRTYDSKKLQSSADTLMNRLMWTSAIGKVPIMPEALGTANASLKARKRTPEAKKK